MEKSAIKEFLYGSLCEIAQNKNYYHKGIAAEYSQLTVRGEAAVRDLVNLWSYYIIKSNEEELDTRAKEMVLKGLKS
jgi:hypothetical protein